MTAVADDVERKLRRVIEPGGELRFYEHVRADDPKWARRQHRLAGMWGWFAGGCNPYRTTEQSIVDAGFDIEHIERFPFAPALPMRLTAPHILGRARR